MQDIKRLDEFAFALCIDLAYQNVISGVGLWTYSRWTQALPHFQSKVVTRVPYT
jgi:hypothetical protein